MNDDDADLEPIDPLGPPGPLESARGPPRRDGGSGARGTERSARPARRRVWAVLAGAAAFWIAAVSWIAISPDHRRSHERASVPSTSAPAATTSVPSFGSDPFGEASGRFAAVVDGRRLLVDAGRARSARCARRAAGADRREQRVVAARAVGGSAAPRPALRRRRSQRRRAPAADGTWLPRIGGGWWIATDGELTSGAERVVASCRCRRGRTGEGWVRGRTGERVRGASTSHGALSLWDPRSGSQRRAGPVARHSVPRRRREPDRAHGPTLSVAGIAQMLDRHRRSRHGKRHLAARPVPRPVRAQRGLLAATVAAWRSGGRRVFRCTTPRPDRRWSHSPPLGSRRCH